MPLGNYNITQPDGSKILLPQGGELDKPNDPLFEQPINQVNLNLSPGQVHGEIAPSMNQVVLSLTPSQTTALVGIFVSLGQVDLSLDPQSYGIELRTSFGQVGLSLTPGQATISPLYLGPASGFKVTRSADYLSTTIEWDAVSLAVEYAIYRAPGIREPFTELTRVNAPTTSYTDNHSDAATDWIYYLFVTSWTTSEGPTTKAAYTFGSDTARE